MHSFLKFTYYILFVIFRAVQFEKLGDSWIRIFRQIFVSSKLNWYTFIQYKYVIIGFSMVYIFECN
jgi:hypothetical protein